MLSLRAIPGLCYSMSLIRFWQSITNIWVGSWMSTDVHSRGCMTNAFHQKIWHGFFACSVAERCHSTEEWARLVDLQCLQHCCCEARKFYDAEGRWYAPTGTMSEYLDLVRIFAEMCNLPMQFGARKRVTVPDVSRRDLIHRCVFPHDWFFSCCYLDFLRQPFIVPTHSFRRMVFSADTVTTMSSVYMPARQYLSCCHPLAQLRTSRTSPCSSYASLKRWFFVSSRSTLVYKPAEIFGPSF